MNNSYEDRLARYYRVRKSKICKTKSSFFYRSVSRFHILKNRWTYLDLRAKVRISYCSLLLLWIIYNIYGLIR